MEHHTSFVPLLVVVLLAFITPLLVSRLRWIRIPVVVGEIVAGMIFGQSGLGWIQPDPWLDVLSTLGFVYLMFLSGLEIDISALAAAPPDVGGSRWKRIIAIPAVAGSLMFGLTLGAAAVAGFGLTTFELARDPWIMGLILSTTSLGIVVPVLKERGMLDQAYGQAILVASLIADFVTMLAISVYVVVRTRGFSLDVLLVLILLGAGLAVYRAALILRKGEAGRILTSLAQATSQVPARGALMLAFVFIALAETLGIEAILGAFLAGAIVALLVGQDGEDLIHKLDAFGYAFFIPIFFINVGANFDLPALLRQESALLLVPLLLLIAYAVKLLPSLVFAPGYGVRAALALGMLTSSRLSLIIAASAIGLEIGAITSGTNAAIVLVAIVTCTLSPLLFNRIAPPLPKPREGVMIVGDTTEAQVLARHLQGRGLPVYQLSAQEFRRNHFANNGGGNARALAALTSDDDTNLAICRAAQPLQMPLVMAQVQSVQNNAAFRSIGAHPVNPALAAVSVFEGLLTNPGALSLLTEENATLTLSEMVVANAALDGQPLRDIQLPHDALVIMVIRRGERLIARGDTQLRIGDVVTVVGSPFALEQTARVMRG